MIFFLALFKDRGKAWKSGGAISNSRAFGGEKFLPKLERGGGGWPLLPTNSDGPFVVIRPRIRPQEENEKTQFKFTLCYRRRAPLFKQVSTHWIND